MKNRLTARLILVVMMTLLIASSCGVGNNASKEAASDDNSKEVTLSVMAAASLTEAFKEIGKAYESENLNVKLEFNFAGSQALATQIEEGGQGDIFASANLKYMDKLTQEGFVESSNIFAKNKLVVAVNKEVSNIEGLGDLTKSGTMIAIADKSVPVGNYTQTVLEKIQSSGEFGDDFKEKISANVVSQELNVKDVVKKVEIDEVDAGFVYATDITPENRDAINIIDIKDDWNVIAEYPIGVLKTSKNMEESQKFVDYLKSDEAKEIFSEYGFKVQ